LAVKSKVKPKVKLLFDGILTGRSEAGCTETVNGIDHNEPFKGNLDLA